MSPRRSQERPKRPQDGPKSAPRAARSAPRGAQEQPGAHQKGPKRAPGRPRSAKKPPGALREAPGVHFGIILGGSGLHFQAIEASFSKLARAPPDNRKQSSKSLVKRSSLGLACVWGQKTQPRRGSSRFLRPRRLTLRIQLASQACFFTRRTSKTMFFLRGSVLSTPFFAHPWLPEARNHTKMLFEITCQKVLQDSCGTEAHKGHGSVAGFWGRMPHWRSGH